MKPICQKYGFFALISALTMALSACLADYTPVYFPPPAKEPPSAAPSEAAPDRSCTISFTSQLCVAIKGEKIEVGTNPDEPVCAEVPPFPLHITGAEITLNGSEFPDIKVEGEGVPAPITINGKGDSTGETNVGRGTIDAAGSITIEDFSFFINVLGTIGEISGLTLTTLSTDELPQLPSIEGKAPDASGAMTLVSGTVLGHLIASADEVLMGASLTAVFSGSISPTLDQCAQNGGPKSVEVKKLFINEKGEQSEENLPDDNRMEISHGTFIAEGPSDIGPQFEAKAKFKIKNISTKAVKIAIPSKIGAFIISSADALSQEIAPQQSITITIIFAPTSSDTEEGSVSSTLLIGADTFKLAAEAKSKSGVAALSTVGDDGQVETANVGSVDIGSLEISANSEKAYFQCESITCGENAAITNCRPCPLASRDLCNLYPVSASGKPLGVVDKTCLSIEPDAQSRMSVDLKGLAQNSAGKKIIAVRNTGVTDLTINQIVLEEVAGSKSKNQFTIGDNAVFLADRFEDIKSLPPAKLPVVLPPFQPKFKEQTLYLLITYQPTDLVGFDGKSAGVGSGAVDKAVLRVITDKGESTLEITGETSILQIPTLELFFKTSTGPKKVENDKMFSFRDVTAETSDSAVPVFLKLADTASLALRVVSINIEGEDAGFYEWLDTPEKISSKTPPTGKGKRCSIPVLDATGQMTNEIFDLKPTSLENGGFNLTPGAYSQDTMPFFGCVNFHRDIVSLNTLDAKKRIFKVDIVVKAQELDLTGNPAKNEDGSFKQTELKGHLLAAINPISGRMVFRITQTSAAILNPQFPGLSSIPAKAERLLKGEATEEDYQVFLGALILDPFDEETIKDLSGQRVLTASGDDITGVFRSLDTHPVDTNYDDPFLFDYASLLYDGTKPAGSRGIFEDFPNVPENVKSNGWRIFTSSLSYPGPLAPPEQKYEESSGCLTVDPCSPEGLKKFTQAGVGPGEKGACAFFYASGGRYDSPAFHEDYHHLCDVAGQPQKLLDIDTGHYALDGSITFEEIGFRFFGPTYFHNPNGPLGPVPPMDVIFHVGFTTETLKPALTPDEFNVLPDEKIDVAKQEYKINLTDQTLAAPPICANNTKNRTIAGRKYSSWKYLAPYLSKDETGTIPAGCPEEGNNLTGGSAFLHGRKLNHETGVVTLVTAANFGPSNDLTFAFKDIMMFVVMNGWLCNPSGDESDFEGARCYDIKFNDRDALSQISILD